MENEMIDLEFFRRKGAEGIAKRRKLQGEGIFKAASDKRWAKHRKKKRKLKTK